MKAITLYGSTNEGKLLITNRYKLDSWIESLPDKEDLIMKINVVSDLKTYEQLRMIYRCFREISDTTGYEVEDVKCILKMKAGLCYTHNIEGTDITQCKSLSDFTKKELTAFIEFTNEWAIKTLNINLLSNEELKFIKS